ncbi:MAG: translocation/assembly module TamB domain-containing protein [Gammaproteobacteria bacterium]|nr:translocation/assembly module TamB domain-containing protein [Gammaproteobacteria bacterium]
MTDKQPHNTTPHHNVGVAKKKQPSTTIKIIKYFCILLCLLFCIVLSTGYYFLNTNSGLRALVSIANNHSGYKINAEEIKGTLINKAELTNLSVKGNNLSLSSESVLLKWEFSALFDRSINITDIIIKNSDLELIPVTEKKQAVTKPTPELLDINLPINLLLENIVVENLTFRNPITKKADFTIENIQIAVDYAGQIGKITKMSLQGEGLDLNLTGNIETKGDFPLTLTNKTEYKSVAYGDEIVEMKIEGALKKALDIKIIGEGISDFTLVGNVTSLLTSPIFNVGVDLHKVNATHFGFPKTSVTANITVDGKLSDTLTLNTAGNIFYKSPETDEISIDFDGSIDEKSVNIPKLTIGLVTAQQQLNGSATYGLANKSIAVNLNSDALQWPQKNETPDFSAKQLAVSITGSLDDFLIKASSNAKTELTGVVPFDVSAHGSQKAIQDFTAKAMIHNQPITLTGSATWGQQIRYNAKITAPEIKAFDQFPEIKELDITVNGDDKSYQATGGLHIASSTIPSSDINLAINGTPKTLALAKLSIDSLGGTTQINANGNLSPLDISAELLANNIQPQKFYPHVSGNINGKITVNAKKHADNFTATTTIHELTGKLQKQPLLGTGVIVFDQAQQHISIDTLALNIAGNRLDANGTLALSATEQSNLTTTIDAKQLSNLLPELRGSLTAELHATGTINKPEIKGTINSNNIAYQQHQIKQLMTKLDISVSHDTLNVSSNIIGLKSGNNLVNNAKLNVSGKISQHQINVNVDTPTNSSLPKAALQANGALNIDMPQWSGQLRKLSINHAALGDWQLQKATDLVISTDNVGVELLCLQQQSTNICTQGKLKQQHGQFNVAIKQLKTKQFAKFLPPTVKVDTTINGNADIELKNGQPNVKGKITADGGTINVIAGSGGLSESIKKLETVFTLKNNRLEAFAISDLKKVGTMKIEALIPNISKGNINAAVKLNSPNLGFLEELSPQLSNVKGKLTGDMTLSGDPSKKLNVAGKITLHKTNLDIPQFGTQIRALTLDIFAKNGNQIGFNGSAQAGGGNFTINGNIDPASRKGEIDIKGKNFQVADSRKLKVAINPDIQIVFADDIKVRGQITIPKALIIPESSGSKITASEDVVLPKNKAVKKQAKSSPVDVELAVKLGNDVRVASADIETRLLGGINILAKPGKAPFANGVISVKKGALRVYGQQLNIQRGRVIFSNGPIANPTLDIRATRTIDTDDITVGVNVLGYASKPQVSLFSTPSMPDSSILSYLLFGKPPNSDTFSSTALLQTGGLVGTNAIARDIKSSTGLDVLDFSLSGVEAGKNLSKKIYVGVRSDFFNAINDFLLDYKISSKTHLKATIGTNGISTDLIKEIETD